MDLKGLPGLGFDPFSIDVGYILFEKRWVIQLAGHISKYKKASRVVSRQDERMVCSGLGPWRMFWRVMLERKRVDNWI